MLLVLLELLVLVLHLLVLLLDQDVGHEVGEEVGLLGLECGQRGRCEGRLLVSGRHLLLLILLDRLRLVRLLVRVLVR